MIRWVPNQSDDQETAFPITSVWNQNRKLEKKKKQEAKRF